ncbi:LD-carboxypeptidase [Bacteroidota bacterium]
MITPPYLQAGDTIGIIAPARSISEAEVAAFVGFMEEAGYKVRLGVHLYGKLDQYSGTVEERLQDLHHMISDDEVKAVFAARGGYGSAQLLPRLNQELMAKNPKWLIGFSDMTAIHAVLNRQMESMHAVMPYSLAMEKPQDEESFASLLAALRGDAFEYSLDDHHLNYAGEASGVLVGGNLSVLYSLAGTPYEPDYEGKILFLEDLDEYLYHIDRMILNFELRGIFEKISGLVIGDLSDMHDNSTPFGKSALEIITQRAHKYKLPTLFGFPAGHNKTNYTLIFGRLATLKVKEGENLLSI